MKVCFLHATNGLTADALVDTGATHNFLSPQFVHAFNLKKCPLLKPRIIRNIDGTRNKGGNITHYVDLTVALGEAPHNWFNAPRQNQRFYVAELGQDHLILGHPWIAAANPTLHWTDPSQNPKVFAAPTNWLNLANFQDGDQVIMRICRTTHAQQLAEKAHDPTKCPWTELVPKELQHFERGFSKEAAQRFPTSKPWDHAIELLPNAPPVLDCKVYPLTQAEQVAQDAFLKEHLQKGYIIPSKSPYAAPFFFVKKKDGKLRPVQDYHRLNSWTRKNRYTLPLISELVQKAPGHNWYSTMDIRWGYNNVRIKDGDQWKAAFKTTKGLFEPQVMFFGLTNSPATFQTIIDDLFREEVPEGWLLTYIDDLLVFTDGSKDDHLQKVARVLQKLQDNDLFLKPEKCHFLQTSVEYLGVIVGQHGIEMDPVKLKGLADWPTPTSVTEVRSFLGFGNFYKPFIEGYAHIARPLHDLTKKGDPFAWTATTQHAFDTTKLCFTTGPVLATIDYSRPFTLQTDTSAFAIGATLTQADASNVHHPVAFYSASLSPAERNYDIYDRELLAIVKAFRAWHHHLLGARHTVTVLTDHNNLAFFREPHKIMGRQARWMETLAEYDFALRHVPGASNMVADL